MRALVTCCTALTGFPFKSHESQKIQSSQRFIYHFLKIFTVSLTFCIFNLFIFSFEKSFFIFIIFCFFSSFVGRGANPNPELVSIWEAVTALANLKQVWGFGEGVGVTTPPNLNHPYLQTGVGGSMHSFLRCLGF